MDTDTSSKPRDPDIPVKFAAALANARGERVVFALRALDLERIAWREGRSRALLRERRAADAFADVCRRTLREVDTTAHAPGSDLFLAALLGPVPKPDLPRTARTVLAEIVRRFGESTGFELEYGWTVYEPGPDPASALHTAVGAAFERGRRESERFAFFAQLGHEMRTPLMSIDGYLRTVLESDLQDSIRRHFIEVAQLEATRLQRLVESMYALSVIDLDADLAHDVTCDAQNAIERACDAIYPTAARRGTSLQLCSRVEFAIPLAAEHAVGVFVGLLENAVKHGRERGRIEVRLQVSGDDLEVTFDDDGPGLAQAEGSDIFEPRVRGRDTVAPGQGLGLSIVRRTVERAGGDVRAERSPLGGARFVVRFPSASALRDQSIRFAPECHTPIILRSP
jgi:signal transduction histidine kinase